MKLLQNYTVNFLSDGTDTLTFNISAPPLSIETTVAEPTALENAEFRPISNVPASPFLKECTLNGEEVTATFSADLPEVDISQQQARYMLTFTLIF